MAVSRGQSISGLPASRKAALILEKGRLPKNPLAADSGEGCADWMIAWRVVLISGTFLRAYAPHNTNTTRSDLSFTARMIASVKLSQPLP